jgi:hypothetical protein
MPESALRLVKCSAEFIPKDRVNHLPRKLRGIYVLYKQRHGGVDPKYDVLYVGMAAAGRRPPWRSTWPPNFSRKVQTEREALDSFLRIRGLGQYPW